MPFKSIEDKRAWHRAWVKANPEKFAESKRKSEARRRAATLPKPPRAKMSDIERRVHERQTKRRPEYRARERVRDRARSTSPERRAYMVAYQRERRRNSPQVRLRDALRTRVRDAMKGKGKGGSTVGLLGCTVAHAVQHIEAQFQPGMTWDTHGIDGWHIDHIIPLAWFDLTDPFQRAKAFHYTNLQPLWAFDNRAKGAKAA